MALHPILDRKNLDLLLPSLPKKAKRLVHLQIQTGDFAYVERVILSGVLFERSQINTPGPISSRYTYEKYLLNKAGYLVYFSGFALKI